MDIDIDVADNELVRSILGATRASIVEKQELKPHLVGVYLQKIPVDALTGLSAIPYKEAEELGYMKIDILNLSFYEYFTSKQEIKQLLKIEPDWNMLQDDVVIDKLFHLAKHGNVLKKLKPACVEDVADVLALIRPNKTYLIDKYLLNKAAVRKELYVKTASSDLRKSHAIPYALVIKLQLHLIKGNIL